MEFETNFSTGIEELGQEIHHVLRSIGSVIQVVEASFHLNRVDSVYQEMSNPSEAGWSIVESEGHGRPLEEAELRGKTSTVSVFLADSNLPVLALQIKGALLIVSSKIS
jgi:hypothetical protein